MFDPSAAAGHEGLFGLPFSPEQAAVVVVPVPWEPTVSYGSGTAEATALLRLLVESGGASWASTSARSHPIPGAENGTATWARVSSTADRLRATLPPLSGRRQAIDASTSASLS
jgi:hypothetical protein